MKSIVISAFLIFKMLLNQNSFAMEKDSYPIDGGLADKFKYLVSQYESDYIGDEFEESGFSIPNLTASEYRSALSFGGAIFKRGAYNLTLQKNSTYQGGTTVRNAAPLAAAILQPVSIDLKELYKLFLKIENDQFFQKEVNDAKQRASSLALEEYARDFLNEAILLIKMHECFKSYADPGIDIFQYMARLTSKNDFFEKYSQTVYAGTISGVKLFDSCFNGKNERITIDIMFRAILEQSDYLKAKDYREPKFLKFYDYLTDALFNTYIRTTGNGIYEYLESRFSYFEKPVLEVLIKAGMEQKKFDQKWSDEFFEALKNNTLDLGKVKDPSLIIEKDAYSLKGGVADKFKYLVAQYEQGDYLEPEFDELFFYIPKEPVKIEYHGNVKTISVGPLSGNHTFSEVPENHNGALKPQIIDLKNLYQLFLKIEEDDAFLQDAVNEAEKLLCAKPLTDYARDFLTNLKLLEKIKQYLSSYKPVLIEKSEIDLFQYMARLISKKHYKGLQDWREDEGGTYGLRLFARPANPEQEIVTIDMMFKAILEQADLLKKENYEKSEFVNFYNEMNDVLLKTYIYTTEKGLNEYLESKVNIFKKETLESFITMGIKQKQIDLEWVIEFFEKQAESKVVDKVEDPKE